MYYCLFSQQTGNSKLLASTCVVENESRLSFLYKMLLVQLKRRACQLAFVNVSCYHVTNPLNNFAAAFQLLGTGLSFQIESNSQRLYNFQHSMVIIKDLFPASKLSILNQKVTTEESRREARDSATKAIKHQKVNT